MEIPYQKRKTGWRTYKYVDLFCANCLTHEDYFKGGGSWTPDLCPCGCEDTIVWYKMNGYQKIKALLKYKKSKNTGE